jgi:hypothetical protein
MITIEGRTGLKFVLYSSGYNTNIYLVVKGQITDKGITVPESAEKIQDRFYRWIHGGEYIQDAFRDWTPYQREFLQTGYTEQEWNQLFGGD